MLIGALEHCCTCFGGGAGICVLLCERQPATGASSARRGPPCCSGCAVPSPMCGLGADGALCWIGRRPTYAPWRLWSFVGMLLATQEAVGGARPAAASTFWARPLN